MIEVARSRDGNMILHQCAEIADAFRVLYLKGSILFFACLRNDNTWPLMMNWASGHMVQLDYLGNDGVGYSFPLPLVSASFPK